MEQHPFEDQCNVLKSIIKHISLYEHFEFLGDSTPKLCKFKIRYFENMAKRYRSSRFVHDGQQFKRNTEMSIMSTPNTTIYLDSTGFIKQFTPQKMD